MFLYPRLDYEFTSLHYGAGIVYQGEPTKIANQAVFI
jgi:hypothetical protein